MASQKAISLYDNIYQNKNGKDIPIDVLLQYIHDGYWQDLVLDVQTGKRKKESLPYVTISGKFSERKIAGLVAHSGFICMDVDDVDPNEIKNLLNDDRYLYAAFSSVSGKGCALIFKINPDKHNEAFDGLQDYLFNTYEIIIDPSCRDVSRARFISWDPGIIINEDAAKFTQYTTRKPEKKVPDVIFVQSDFDEIVREIVGRHIDLTGDYNTWLRIGFALSDKFGEAGRSYFHHVSQFHPKYTPQLADRQYTNCLKANRQGVTIATFYYLAKEAGIPIISEKTKVIAQTAYMAKKGRTTKEAAIKVLADAEGITPEESYDIVNQVFDNNIEVHTDDSPIEALEMWLRQNYEFRKNAVTLKIECDGKELSSELENTIYVSAKKVFETLNFDNLDRLINSKFSILYNPLIDFFERYKDRQPTGVIRKLFDTIESDTGLTDGQFFPDYKYHFGTKWLVGMISAAHGKHSPLMLVLSGIIQNTGKTEWFRRLLPEELRYYYGETKFENGKDDELLMTQKWLILDDEMSGKKRDDYARLKELLSKQTFYLRPPFGRHNMDIPRYAVICGTTNHTDLLNDPTGNRRIIPINVIDINQDAYNAIDKIDVLMEAYHLYRSGFKWEMTRDDISLLEKNTEDFKQLSTEFELVTKYFRRPEDGESCMYLTGTDIKVFLENITNQNLNPNKLGAELKKVLGEPKSRRMIGKKDPLKTYAVIKLSELSL